MFSSSVRAGGLASRAARRRAPATILLVPFADGIGDFVNMLPIVEAVRARYPDARLTVAASGHARQLLPDDAVVVATPSWLRRGPTRPFVALRWLVSQRLVATASTLGLRGELGRFDLTINLFRTWEHGMAFARDWTPQVPARPGAIHTLDYLAEQLGAWDLELPPARRFPRLASTPDARARTATEWERLGLTGAPVVGLVPASNMAIKQWPLDSWVRLNDVLQRRGLRTVVFLPDPMHPCARLLELAGRPPAPFVGDLSQVAAGLERCRLVVGVDTGLLHMAAALGTPYVGLFGPTNPDVTGPYDRALGICLIAPFPKERRCTGCWESFKYEDDRCRVPSRGSCTTALDVGAVVASVDSLLARGGAGGTPSDT